MSWWSSSEIEKEILKATSSSIPSGEQDLALNLEISDSVRSKQASASEVVKVLRKRLYDRNPNVQILTLHLLDLLIKNGGMHFFVESASKEFVDSYVAQLMSLVNQNRNPEVIELMLDYFQTWALASSLKPEGTYLRDKYAELKKRRDLTFPDPSTASEMTSSFIEAATAPEWIDSDTCMKSGQPFTFYNRKHHCRNCGGVFLQEYCSNFRPLPHFGINIPVRICEDCDAKLDAKYGATPKPNHESNRLNVQNRKISSNNQDIGSRYRDDLEQAINLSLKVSQQSQHLQATAGGNANAHENEEVDDDLKRAIEESLKEIKQSEQSTGYQTSSQPQQQQMEPTQPVQKHEPEPAVPVADRNDIEEFSTLVQMSSPREAIYNQRLIRLNDSALTLQPKIITELRVTSNKLGILEDLHGKLMAVTSYYDRLLEAELNPGIQPQMQRDDSHSVGPQPGGPQSERPIETEHAQIQVPQSPHTDASASLEAQTPVQQLKSEESQPNISLTSNEFQNSPGFQGHSDTQPMEEIRESPDNGEAAALAASESEPMLIEL